MLCINTRLYGADRHCGSCGCDRADRTHWPPGRSRPRRADRRDRADRPCWPRGHRRQGRLSRLNGSYGSHRAAGRDRRDGCNRPYGADRAYWSGRQERISGGGRSWVYRDRGAAERGPGCIAGRPVSPHRRGNDERQHQYGQQHNKRPDGWHGLHYHTSARHIPCIDIARHPAKRVHSYRVLIRRITCRLLSNSRTARAITRLRR